MQEQASRQKRQGKEPYRTKRARIREETGTLYIYVYICVCTYLWVYIYIYPYIQVWQKDKRFYQTAASPFTLDGESNLLVRAIDGQVFLTFQTYKMHPSSFKRDKDWSECSILSSILSRIIQIPLNNWVSYSAPFQAGLGRIHTLTSPDARLGPIQRSRSWRGHRNWRLENPPRVDDVQWWIIGDFMVINGD